MQLKWAGNAWHRTVWKILRNPALEVVVAIVVVLLLATFVIQSEVERHVTAFPLWFGHK